MILRWLLRADVDATPITDVAAWWARHDAAAAPLATPIDRALAGGFASDRLGYAFASGYQEALRALTGEPTLRAAFCVTEVGGGQPSAIATRLVADGDGWRLTGTKAHATLAAHIDTLLVVAGLGVDGAGLHRLAVVRVPADRAGVTRQPLPRAPVAPELPHARLVLDDVRVEASERLPGDGYDDYVKPFRTLEDLHVHAAVLGYLTRVARRSGWPEVTLEGLAAMVTTARALAAVDLRAPESHLALAGALAELGRWLSDVEPRWAEVEPGLRADWMRDRPLLGLASKARARRRELAWTTVRGERA